uniref:EF-hand domain-containing protein n=1 Tax=Spongospora subterranea TaxID=70186 RepID=A0A0H5R5M6_9EUKA|eukprot:CRZ09082.1 hypothetical protein [Spongospora subterranea]
MTVSRIELMRSLKDSPVSEDDAVAMFAWANKSPDDDVWDAEDLRLFLVELCIAFDLDPVVTDESVESAIRELQLDSNEHGRISKMEWKSFFLYLLDSPLNHLANSAFRSNPRSTSQPAYPSGQTVVISFAGPNVMSLNKVIAQSAIRKAVGATTSFEFAKKGENAAMLVVFETPILVETALSLHELPTLDISDINVSRYNTGAVFPSWAQPASTPTRNPGMVAKALASTVLFGAMVGSQARVLDERVGFSSTAKSAFLTTKGAVVDTDQKLGISRSVKEAASTVDHKLHISETAAKATKKTSEAIDQVKETEQAKTAMASVGEWFGKLKLAAGGLKAETEVAIEQKRLSK